LRMDRMSSAVVVNSGDATNVQIHSSVMVNTTMCTVGIIDGNTTGAISGVLDIDKLTINPASVVQVDVQDPVSGDLSITGTLGQGASYNTTTDISTTVQQGGSLGVISGGALTVTTGLTISVAAGTGYLKIVSASGALKFVTWVTTAKTVPASTTTFVFVDSAGVVQTGTATPNVYTTVLLGSLRSDGVVITFLQNIARVAAHSPVLLDEMQRLAFGPVYRSGSLASASGTARGIDVGGGTYYFGTHAYSPTGGAPVTLQTYRGGGLGTFVAAVTQLATPFEYDNGTALVAVPGGQFAKHLVYVVNDGVDERYLLVYGTVLFVSSGAAEAGALPTPPSTFSGNLATVAGVVVEGGRTAFTSILDVRPTASFAISTTGATPTDHQSLVNRADPACHSQYYLKAGDTMSGTLNMGTNPVTNAGQYNGVTVQLHGARHNPGGPDPLAVGVPVSIASNNQTGSAASYAISNHVHAHGTHTDPTNHALATGAANGFMSSTDKALVDTATATPTNNALVQYTAAAALAAVNFEARDGSTLRLLDSTSSNANGVSLTAPVTVDASGYTLTFPLNAGGSNQFLRTNGTGTLTWATPVQSSAVCMVSANAAGDINTTSRTTITWDVTRILDPGYTLLGGSQAVQVTNAGRYDVYFMLVYTGNVGSFSSFNTVVELGVNGAIQPGSGRNGSIAESSQNESSNFFRTIVDLSAGDSLTATCKREASSGTLTLISGESLFIIQSL
jgi:hypothetical protein